MPNMIPRSQWNAKVAEIHRELDKNRKAVLKNGPVSPRNPLLSSTGKSYSNTAKNLAGIVFVRDLANQAVNLSYLSWEHLTRSSGYIRYESMRASVIQLTQTILLSSQFKEVDGQYRDRNFDARFACLWKDALQDYGYALDEAAKVIWPSYPEPTSTEIEERTRLMNAWRQEEAIRQKNAEVIKAAAARFKARSAEQEQFVAQPAK